VIYHPGNTIGLLSVNGEATFFGESEIDKIETNDGTAMILGDATFSQAKYIQIEQGIIGVSCTCTRFETYLFFQART
jgi:hypothetical protein